MRLKTLAILITTTLLFACAKNSSSTTGAQNNTPIGDTNQLWQSVEAQLNSQAEGGMYDQYSMLRVDQATETLKLAIPLPPTSIKPIDAQFPPALAGLKFESEILADGTEAWVISVPLKYILHGAQLQQFTSLPNGDPLPYFPSGEINGLTLSLPQRPNYKVTLYFAVNAVAIFVETPNASIPIGLGVKVKNSVGTSYTGYFKIVPTKGAFSSGVYLMAVVPTSVAQTLNKLVHF